MDRTQAIATIQQAMLALFPYADPKDDPDRRRAADQIQCREALAVLALEGDVVGIGRSATRLKQRLLEGASWDSLGPENAPVRERQNELMDDEEKVLAGRLDANMPALLTKDVQGG
jgi:hypothetical protein